MIVTIDLCLHIKTIIYILQKFSNLATRQFDYKNTILSKANEHKKCIKTVI